VVPGLIEDPALPDPAWGFYDFGDFVADQFGAGYEAGFSGNFEPLVAVLGFGKLSVPIKHFL